MCAAALLVTSLASAQGSVTLTLRSGEKVSGQLVDLGGAGYTVQVNGNERQIPQNDVAVIDFTGGTMSDADWAAFNDRPQVVLSNGETFNGTLYDISGTSPLRLTIRTSDGERQLASSEVARIVISRPENATATSGTSPASTPRGTRRGTNSAIAVTAPVPGAITVQATQPWTSTGISVRKGQRISFSTTGEVQLSDDPTDIANPDGARKGRYAANAPLRQVLAGALIGRIGNGVPFAIGNQTSIVAPASGQLFLGVNDDGFGDNSGNFQVVVR